MFQKIVQVIPTNDYCVYLYFDDGKIKIYDASQLISQGVFQKLQDIQLFMSACTVLNNTLAWDLAGRFDPTDCLDLDPEELYNICPEVVEPTLDNLALLKAKG